MIAVLRRETGCRKIWATIGYGWESLDVYRKWGGLASDLIEIKGPYLDPLNPQTKYSPALLNLFCFLLQSREYVERLQRHYQMFRDSVQKEYGRRETIRTANTWQHLRPRSSLATLSTPRRSD